MMFSSQFDAGFSASQLTQSDSGPSPAKNRDPQGVVPLTVMQISQASHSTTDDKSNFHIDGVNVNNVKLVGMVFDKIEKVTDVSFILDDGTGVLAAKDGNGMYVQLVGHLRTFKGNTEILAFSVRPVSNFDEVTLHFVECIYQHIQNNKSQPSANSLSQSQMESSQSTPIKTESSGYHSSPPHQMSVDGLKDLDQRVLDYLRQSSQETGVHRDDIARNLKLSVEKIMESITCLEDEGLIYSTIDEFHFKSTA